MLIMKQDISKIETIQILNSLCFIDRNGNIYNTDTCKYANWTKHNRTKLLITNIKINGIRKTIYKHKVLAEYFIPNYDNKKYVDFINGDIEDNRIENLIWVNVTSRRANAYKNSKIFYNNNNISYKSVIDIETNKIYKSVSDAAINKNISRTYLSNMLNGIVENKTSLKYYN